MNSPDQGATDLWFDKVGSVENRESRSKQGRQIQMTGILVRAGNGRNADRCVLKIHQYLAVPVYGDDMGRGHGGGS